MTRSLPFLSPLGILLTLLMLLGLGLALWLNGGQAFSPGSVSAQLTPQEMLAGFSSHADFEKECSRCHQPLKSDQASLCIACHKNVGSEISDQTGLHGQIKGVNHCYTCHSEHRGRGFDLSQDALARFDHRLASFSLIWHQVNFDTTPMTCPACHTIGDPRISLSLKSCSDCHAGKDPEFMRQHLVDYGESCLTCHDGQDRMAHFKHGSTAFPLEGAHAQVRCIQCHTRERLSGVKGRPFAGTPADCVKCHVEPPAHQGVFEADCKNCHTPAGWSPATVSGKPFTHTKTSFSLALHTKDYAGKTLTCAGCHPAGVNSAGMQTCVACHQQKDAAFMQQHLQTLGSACLECHDGVDRMRGFDHAAVFVLEGRHVQIECQTCHTSGKYQDTPKSCVGCHAEPKIHAGFFGLECQSCHTTTAWTPALLRAHRFPLDHGGQGIISCLLCHPKSYAEYTCYGCHDHQPDPIAKSHAKLNTTPLELIKCAKCHPTGLK